MKIIQVCKRINNDESGGNKNHDYFINLPNIDINTLLFNSQTEIDFIDKRDNEIINLSLYKNRNWIKKIRPYYEKYDLHAGDEIILERRIHNNAKEEYYIDHLKYNGLIFQKKSFYNEKNDKKFQTFECINGDINSFKEKYSDLISINSLGHFKRSKDKKTKNNKKEKEYFYECFEIIQNDENLLQKYNVNDLIEIEFVNKKINVTFINKGIIYEMDV